MDPEELARLAALAAGGALTRKAAQIGTAFRPAAPSSYNAETHTVDLTAATGTRVKRYSWMMDGYYWEQLAITADAVDLDRVTAGQCPLLDTHNRYGMTDQFGIVTVARFEGDQLVLTTQFRTSAEAVAAEADVAAGTVRGVSIGYAPLELTLTSVVQDDLPVYLVTSWELLEVSLCPVPADPAAGVRSEDGLHPCVILKPKETRVMDPEELARIQREAEAKVRKEIEDKARADLEVKARADAEAKARADADAKAKVDASAARMDGEQALTFSLDARAFGVEDAQITTWATTLTPDAARAELLKVAAEKQRKEAPLKPSHSVTITTDERSTQRAAMGHALILRHDPAAKLKAEEIDMAREWRAMSLMEMFRYAEEANGRKVRGLSKRELADLVFDRANSTSDFTSVLANVANKTLRDGYEGTPQTFKAWMRPATAVDFKQVSRIQLSGAPSFLAVPEGGQFKLGSLSDAKEVYALATYGRIVPLTRQTIINDDLDAFTRLPNMMGRAAADFESDAAYAPINANPNMGDGAALFSTGAGNQAASGAAISVTTAQAAEVAMAAQTGLEGRPITVTPKYLLTAVKDRVPAAQLLTAILAQTTSAVNPYSNAFTQITEVRLGRTSGAVPWYFVADYNQVDTFEYAYLEGESGVYLETRQGFEVDGMELKGRLDFAVKAIDRRGVYQNPGT